MHDINITEFEAFCREQRGLGDHTLRAYRQDLQAFQTFVAAYGEFAEIGRDTILGFQRHLREVLEASPATVRRRIVTLRAYFNWAEIEKGDVSSPFAGLRLDLRVPQRLPRPVDRPTLAAIFRNSKHIAAVNAEPTNVETAGSTSSKDQVTGLITRILVVTGLRIGELTHIRLKDVTGAGSQIRVLGKGNRERTVYVTNDRLPLDFSTYLKQRQFFGDHNAFVFLNTRGSRLTEAAFRKGFGTFQRFYRSRLTSRHTGSGTLLPRFLSRKVLISALFNACSATRAFRQRKSIPRSPTTRCSRPSNALTPSQRSIPD